MLSSKRVMQEPCTERAFRASRRFRRSHRMNLLLGGSEATFKDDVAKRFLDRAQFQVIDKALPPLLH